jgi:type IV pilus assembly protein PilA
VAVRKGLAQRKSQGLQGGFSLIELLVVVTIILIIAAISIPNFLRARIAANEASAVTSVHSICSSELTYYSISAPGGYSAALADLGPAKGDYIDSSLAAGQKSGYNFTYNASGVAPFQQYTINADPVVPSITGQRHYYADETNITRVNPTAKAGAGDPPL